MQVVVIMDTRERPQPRQCYCQKYPVVTSSRFQSYLASNPWSSPYGKPPELVSFKLLLDTRTLVFVMRGGDIATAPLDESPVTVCSSLDFRSHMAILICCEGGDSGQYRRRDSRSKLVPG